MDRYAIYTEDGEFAAPKYVRDINQVPESHRDWYVRHGIGKKAFRLKREIWVQLEPLAQKLSQMEGEQRVARAKLEADIASNREGHARERVTVALQAALRTAGVQSSLARGATALLHQTNEFSVEDTDVIAHTPFGQRSVEGLVAVFLESDEGAAYRPKQAIPTSGYFTSLVAEMRHRNKSRQKQLPASATPDRQVRPVSASALILFSKRRV